MCCTYTGCDGAVCVPTRFTIALRGFSLLAPDHSAHADMPRGEIRGNKRNYNRGNEERDRRRRHVNWCSVE